MSDKNSYRNFCKEHEKIPIFSQAFWLNEVAENWDVILEQNKNNEIIAALPFCWKGNFITQRIYLPFLNFYQSILFFNVDEKHQQEIAERLFNKLPRTIKSYFKFLLEYDNIQLNTLGFSKENYSTYIIQKNEQLQLSNNHKRNVKKGIERNYQIKESKNLKQTYEMLVSTFIRQKIKSKISFEAFQKIQTSIKQHQCCKIVDCLDNENNILASVFILSDNQTVYYMLGGYETKYKNSGAMTFLLHHLIKETLDKNKTFNFCGSSNKNIAHFFEGFGATKTSINIWKKSIL
ncbi:MAG: GNAT family N-acetyltransferase [Bacteroidetes bacterium]|nr:GNAT family N-acetyltransferase [Bacteroidota bacterium]